MSAAAHAGSRAHYSSGAAPVVDAHVHILNRMHYRSCVQYIV